MEPNAAGSGDDGVKSGDRPQGDVPASDQGLNLGAPQFMAPLGSPIFWVPGAGTGMGTGSAAPSPPPSRTDDNRANAHRQAAAGWGLMNKGQYRAAMDHFHEAIWLNPDEPEYHHLLAGAAEKLNEPELVERHLNEAVRLDACYAPAQDALGVWYRRQGRLDRAVHHSGSAVALAPRNDKYIADHGTVLFMMGKVQEAWEVIEPLVSEVKPVNRWLAHFYARIAPAIGREKEALALLEKSLEAPDLSDLPEGKPLLLFSAVTLLDKMGRHDEAFEYARRANELVASSKPPYDAARHSQWVTDKIGYFTRARLDSLPRATHGNRRPVFIVGMPRSGTSLVEQILASHPAVYGAGELNQLRRLVGSASNPDWAEGDPYPQSLDWLSTRWADRLAAQYLGFIDTLDRRATYVTDKMPSNVLFLELVELLMPGSRIIHCIRGPLDTCLSCYMTNFATAHEFTQDLTDLGAYYRDYRRLMDHWKRVLSVPIIDVRYEDLVLDTEGQVGRLLEFLDLPWDEHCLRYWETDRRTKTASEDQVRRPIYTSAIGRWKQYESHLGPLIAALGRSNPGAKRGSSSTSGTPSSAMTTGPA